ATGATQEGSGCAGCLGKVLLLGVIVAGGATIVAINASESELGVKIRDVWHEVEREMRASKHRKHTPPPYVAPPPRPRPVSPAPPDPWAVAAQPTSPGPDALSAPLVAAEDDAPQPLDSRAKAIATALDRRALLLLRCVQPEAKPGEPRKVTARTTLRVHAESGGALDVEAVIEPPDAPAGALRCLRLAARGLVVPNGDAVTFVYRWPKGSER
ncbi:MAG: hypothetical protein FJ100_18995, partial [Deltaproteobacteria bacterium]|nr:hypothetical protein [Deltaproteobacteria bacterium]